MQREKRCASWWFFETPWRFLLVVSPCPGRLGDRESVGEMRLAPQVPSTKRLELQRLLTRSGRTTATLFRLAQGCYVAWETGKDNGSGPWPTDRNARTHRSRSS